MICTALNRATLKSIRKADAITILLTNAATLRGYYASISKFNYEFAARVLMICIIATERS